jgi:hypothetical protein
MYFNDRAAENKRLSTIIQPQGSSQNGINYKDIFYVSKYRLTNLRDYDRLLVDEVIKRLPPHLLPDSQAPPPIGDPARTDKPLTGNQPEIVNEVLQQEDV